MERIGWERGDGRIWKLAGRGCEGGGVAEGVCSANAAPSGKFGAQGMGAIEVGGGNVERGAVLVDGGAWRLLAR